MCCLELQLCGSGMGHHLTKWRSKSAVMTCATHVPIFLYFCTRIAASICCGVSFYALAPVHTCVGLNSSYLDVTLVKLSLSGGLSCGGLICATATLTPLLSQARCLNILKSKFLRFGSCSHLCWLEIQLFESAFGQDLTELRPK